MKLFTIFILISIKTSGQISFKPKTLNQYLDGYAWQFSQKLHPGADQSIYVYYGNKEFIFFDRDPNPNGGTRYYFRKECNGNNDDLLKGSKSIPISSLEKDIVIDYKATSMFECAFVEDSEEQFMSPNTNYSSPLSTISIENNNKNMFKIDRCMFSGYSTGVYVERIYEPPVFVQAFIKSLKKNVLVPVKRKCSIYKSPAEQTKMYLIANDFVEMLEKKEQWVYIRYYGKKTVEGWIRGEDLN